MKIKEIIMSKKPTVLMILDGYGLNDKKEGNAIAAANTPVMDELMKTCPFVPGNASGMAVGLPEGQMGNSEVGHLNMGAGRIVYQELTRITKEIQDGDFFENEALLQAVENCKKNGSALHAMGSDGLISCVIYLDDIFFCIFHKFFRNCYGCQRIMFFLLIFISIIMRTYRKIIDGISSFLIFYTIIEILDSYSRFLFLIINLDDILGVVIIYDHRKSICFIYFIHTIF